MKRGAEKVAADLESLDFEHPARLLAQLAGSISTMGGTSGVILDIFFRACGNRYAAAAILYLFVPRALGLGMCVCCSLAAAAEADGLALLAALQAGTDKITFYGGAEEGMRTLLVRPHCCCLIFGCAFQTSGVCQDAMIPAHRGGGAVAKAGTPAAAVVGAMATAGGSTSET